MGFSVAVVGIGAVGQAMLRVLRERRFPVDRVKVLARRERTETVDGVDYPVRAISETEFDDVDIALFAGTEGVGGASETFAPAAVARGCFVVDNSSAFRMFPNVPLVVPEVNLHAIGPDHRHIANPNCSTIQMVVALKPIHDAARIKRIVVSTYQSVSGTGKKAMDELIDQTRALLSFKEPVAKVYPYQIAFNCLPQIDIFLDNGYTKEEMKMVWETKKIFGDDSIAVTATTVRVPVLRAHSESVNIETERKITAAEVRDLLRKAPGVVVVDDPAKREYPLAIHAAGKDATYVGRIREDESIPNGINLWVVSDNLRKGAALNAIQIAEIYARDYLK